MTTILDLARALASERCWGGECSAPGVVMVGVRMASGNTGYVLLCDTCAARHFEAMVWTPKS